MKLSEAVNRLRFSPCTAPMTELSENVLMLGFSAKAELILRLRMSRVDP